jgi:predicted transposase/invertase (TIGR01784 family)
MKFVNPRNDVAFKKIFGNEEHTEILISFLNAVLDLTGDKEIQEIELLNPYQTPRLEALKYTLLDVRAKDRRGVTFIVEMQIKHVEGLRKRFTYYASKTYASQIERGQDYPKLNQVIFIGILDFAEFDTDHYLTRIQLVNTVTYQQELTDLEFNFIELPKFTKQEHELTTVLEKWIFFLKHAEELDVIPDSADTVALRRAYDIANQFSWTPEELDVYEYWGIKEQDERGAVQYALNAGRQQERFAAARRMLADGLAPDIIQKYTDLTADELADAQPDDAS